MSAARPVRVFLSYARADRARAASLADALQAAGIDVWWDTAIAGGASFSADIERELEAADVVVVAWSAASVKSTWVLDEAGAGRDRGRLVPVRFDATQPPLGFRQFQAVDLADWKGRAGHAGFAALVAAVHRLAGAEPVVPAPVAPAATGPSRRLLIGGAVGVAALAGGGAWFGWRQMAGTAAGPGTTSIAVLPFANLSGDPAQAYVADGIAEELRSALATIAGLRVAARTSSELLRNVEITEAAAKLGVAHVLTGSVRRGEGKIRVTAQLLDGETGLESWSQAYDRTEGDVLDVQTGIAQSVANALSLQFGRAASLAGGTRNPVAYDAYLRATANQLVGLPGYRAALADIDIALAADSEFALAHAFRGLILINIAGLSQGSRSLLNESIAAANKAISLLPQLRLAHATIGRAHQFLLDFAAAEIAFAKAATLSPGTGRGIILEANYHSAMRRPARALALADLAISLDPLNQVPVRNRAGILLDDRKVTAGLALIEGWDRANPDNPIYPRFRFRALLMAGRPREALAAAQASPVEAERLFGIAVAQAKLGNRAASDSALAALQSGNPEGLRPYRLALIRAAQGEAELALRALSLALESRDGGLSSLRVDEQLDPLRRDPRFMAIERQLGFPPA